MKNPPNIKLITDINKRHFRFLLSNRRFLKIKDTIHNSKDLQRWLVKLKPFDVYYSTSTYLDPTSVTPRPGLDDYWGPGNIVLGNDIAFDLDRQPLSILNLERARNDAVKLLAFMKNKGYTLKYLAFSGSKGFHLVFEDFDKQIEEDFKLREKKIIEKRKKLVKEIKELGVVIDSSVTVDTRRIIRLPGTINSKTGYCCSYVSEETLNSPVSNWIDDILVLPNHLKIPRFNWKKITKSKRKKFKKAPKRDTKYAYSTYISSSVLGTSGRHAVLASFSLISQKRIIEILLKAQKEYDLTDIYLFKLPNNYQAICLKTVQRNRYQKILDYTKSSSANQLRRYNRVSLRMGPLVDSDMNIIEPSAKFETIIECLPAIRDKNYVSQGHIIFLKKHGFTPLAYPKIHGSKEFNLIDAELQI
jgi:DNA primase catalytic subunit